MRIHFSRKLAVAAVFSLAWLFTGRALLPVLAQVPTSEPPPSPIEPAIPPIAPIEPETIPPVQKPPLRIDPTLTDPSAPAVQDASLDEGCLPLSDSDELRFTADNINVTGSTVLQSEIAQKVACYEGKEITLSDLFNLRSQITQLYIDNGYVTSGAFVPNGQIIDDQLEIQVIEGSVEAVQINGLKRLRTGYVRSRLARATRPPLNQQILRETLQRLQLDPNIGRVNAELTAGVQPGQSLLILDLKETKALGIISRC